MGRLAKRVVGRKQRRETQEQDDASKLKETHMAQQDESSEDEVGGRSAGVSDHGLRRSSSKRCAQRCTGRAAAQKDEMKMKKKRQLMLEVVSLGWL